MSSTLCDSCSKDSENAMLKVRNAELHDLVREIYRQFHGVVMENWSYQSDDFVILREQMRGLGIEVDE